MRETHTATLARTLNLGSVRASVLSLSPVSSAWKLVNKKVSSPTRCKIKQHHSKPKQQPGHTAEREQSVHILPGAPILPSPLSVIHCATWRKGILIGEHRGVDPTLQYSLLLQPRGLWSKKNVTTHFHEGITHYQSERKATTHLVWLWTVREVVVLCSKHRHHTHSHNQYLQRCIG
jgi:hypothetical protein